MHEIWKPVLGFEGLYEVSNLGQVKSLERLVENNGLQRHVVRASILGKTVNGVRARKNSLSASREKVHGRT